MSRFQSWIQLTCGFSDQAAMAKIRVSFIANHTDTLLGSINGQTQ